LYGGRMTLKTSGPDPLQVRMPGPFEWLRRKSMIDELYSATVIRGTEGFVEWVRGFDDLVVNAGVRLATLMILAVSWVNRAVDEFVINPGFDGVCKALSARGGGLARLQNGRIQSYIRLVVLGSIGLLLWQTWRWWS
jgi:NADH-quinone oxidoreductase subunit L